MGPGLRGGQEIKDRLDQYRAPFETAASRPPQDEDFLNAIRGLPHAEERPGGASRSTHNRDAANFLTVSCAGLTRKAAGLLDKTSRSGH